MFNRKNTNITDEINKTVQKKLDQEKEKEQNKKRFEKVYKRLYALPSCILINYRISVDSADCHTFYLHNISNGIFYLSQDRDNIEQELAHLEIVARKLTEEK